MVNTKAESLEREANAVNQAFRQMYPTSPPQAVSESDAWVMETFDSYLIVSYGNKYYRVEYTRADDKITFQPIGEWKEVEEKREWIGKVKALKVGARNNASDAARLQQIHDLAAENGAMCARPPEVMDLPLPGVRSVEGNALKTVSKDEDTLRVANYMVLFGGRDLTGIVHGKNRDGSLGEYFTKNTDFESDYTRSNHVLVDWEHGLLSDDIDPGSDDILGYVDWKTARKDDRGLFVERVLYRHKEYVQWLEELIDNGLIGNSTEVAPKNVRRRADGEIAVWPIKRDSLTVTPMEPRMLSENTLQALKALGVSQDFIKSLLPAEPARAQTAEVAGATPDVSTGPELAETKSINHNGVNEMTDNVSDVQAIAKAAAEEAVKAYAASLPAEKTAGYAGVSITGDEADRALAGNPFKSFGDFMLGVRKAAYGDEDKRLAPLREDGMYSLSAPAPKGYKATGLNEAIPSQGGYLTQPTYVSGILDKMYNVGQILSKVNFINLGPNSNSIIVPGVDETSRADGSRMGGVLGYWLAEAATKTATKPKFRQIQLFLHKVAALVYATDELLADVSALDSWMTSRVPQELTFKAEAAYYSGDGVGKPLGFMNSPALVSVARDTASKVLAVDIFAMWSRFWMSSRTSGSAAWMVGPDTESQLMSLYLQTGISFPWYTIDSSGVSRIMGLPVIVNEYSPALNTAGDITLVDWAQYYATRKGGVEAASSIHVAFTTDETAYRFVFRTDGQPAWNSPLTPYNASGTLSPFVSLGSATA